MNPKHALFEEFARVAQALGHAHRLGLLEHAAQGERTVEGLAAASGLSVANASQHLKLLRRAGLVSARRNGKFVLYRVADDAVLALVAALRRVAERNVAEVASIVRSYFDARDTLEPVSREELVARLRADEVTVLDVRPAEEFGLGHVLGAVNVPLNTLEAHLATMDPARAVVAYCRGPWCVLSFDAVAVLRERGFDARRLEDGFPEWRAAGLPCATA